MLRIDRILCPVDFSEFSVGAYDYAQSLARQYEAKLFLQHVAEPLLTLYSDYILQITIDETYVQQTEHVQEQLRTLIARHKDRSTEPEVVLHQGYPAGLETPWRYPDCALLERLVCSQLHSAYRINPASSHLRHCHFNRNLLVNRFAGAGPSKRV